MTSGPVELSPVAPAPDPAAPGTEDDVELDEAYLRSLHIDHLVAVLDKVGVVIPESVDTSTAKSIVDYVVTQFGE